MAKSDRLETGLRAAAEKSQLNSTEIRRREDLLLALRFKAKEMAAVLTSAQSAANRSALLGRDGRSLVAVETERTASRDNKGLVALQQEIMQEQDSELEELESTVATTKHIALTINGELDLHRHLLDDFDDNIQSTNARVQLAKKKMSIFMRRSDNTCNMLLVMLVAAGLGAADGGGGGDSDEENGVERPEIVASVERVEATEAALLAARIAAEDVAGDAEGKQPPLPAKTAPEPPAAGKMYACKTVDKILNVEGGAATQKRLSARDIEVRVSALKHEIKVLEHVGYHPNIVKVVGVYNNEKRLRLVMELCDAGDLLGLLTNPPKKPQAEVKNEDNGAAGGANKEGDSNKGAAGRETKPEQPHGKPFTKISQFFKGLAKGTIDPKAAESGAATNGDSSSSSSSSSSAAQPEKMLQTGLSERQTALMFRQLVKAVEHCHSRHVIHRDIKLENVLLNNCCCCKCKPAGADGGAQENGNQQQQQQQQQQQGEPSTCSGYVVKLADFGLAKLLQPTQAMANGNKGSQLYKAPEVAQGRWYTTQADMWSLGVVLYALLSARFPPRDAQGMVAWEAVSDQRLLFKGGSWKEVSGEAKALVGVLLSWDPKLRPNCGEVFNDPWLVQHCR
ncbi:unnamed protein product [Closterium sp. Naga37s-1]|nr:unnamed protein product [Closterium sp. Naga37s-1]